MPDYQKHIVYLSEAQKEELFLNGSITVDGRTITYSDSDLYLTPQAAPLTDVQINGASIVQNGVANVPLSKLNTFGALRAQTDRGINYMSEGVIQISNASGVVKIGTNMWRPIVPSIQHESAFYGLAKAAGDSTQSASSNAVGSYTDEAKVAIQNMLGVNRAFEFINQVTISEDRPANTPLIINTDSNGQSFELDAVSVFISVPETSATTMNGYFSVMKGSSSDHIGLRFNNFGHASYPMRNLVSASLARSGQITTDLKSQINEANTIYFGMVKWTPETITADYIYDFCIRDNTIPAGTVIEIWGHRI